MSTLSQPPRLANLPSEIQNAIISLLDGFDRLVLRMTNRHFRGIIPVTTDDLLAAEQGSLSLEIDLYGCYDCLRLRRAAQFADNMRKGKRRRGGSRPSSRFCIDCGLNPRPGTTRYTQGNIIITEGKRFMKCWCGRYNVVAEDSFDGNSWLCIRCWEPVARRRREKEREQEQLRCQQEKAARAQIRAEKRARLRELGWPESELDDMVTESSMSEASVPGIGSFWTGHW